MEEEWPDIMDYEPTLAQKAFRIITFPFAILFSCCAWVDDRLGRV